MFAACRTLPTCLRVTSTCSNTMVDLANSVRSLHLTHTLEAEPLKKRRRIDPATFKVKVDRKIAKIEKAIRLLKKGDKVLKPILEKTVPPHVFKELDTRKREDVDFDNLLDEHKKLFKIWSLYRREVNRQQDYSLKSVLQKQEKALCEAKALSEDLYNHCLEIDQDFLPFSDEKIICESPPNASYIAPDGRKTNVTKEWIM